MASLDPQLHPSPVVLGRHPQGHCVRCFLNSCKSESKPCELNAISLGVGVCVEEGDRVCVWGGDDITGRAPSIFTPVCGGTQATYFFNPGLGIPP